MLTNDDGQPITVKQVCDAAWDQFGIAAIVAELAARLAWNARFESPNRAELISKDADAMLKIAERLERWTAEDAVV